MKLEDSINERRVLTAHQIEVAIKDNGLSKKQFAALMNRQPSEVTKWLSGKHNFTNDLLAEISFVLHTPITGVSSICPSDCVKGFNQHMEDGILKDSVSDSVALPPIEIKSSCFRELYRKASAKGVSITKYLESLIENDTRRVSASDFYGAIKDFPTYEEIRSARTQNSYPEL